MTTTDLSLEEIYNLAIKTLKHNGCDELNAEAVANTVTNAERDGVYHMVCLEFQDMLLR
jgi:delta1-piperideine-2-carboxylate reductase